MVIINGSLMMALRYCPCILLSCPPIPLYLMSRTTVPLCVSVCVCECVRVCACACVCMFMGMCERNRLCMGFVRCNMHASMHTAGMRASMHTHVGKAHAHAHARTHAHTHTHTHTHTHKHTHTRARGLGTGAQGTSTNNGPETTDACPQALHFRLQYPASCQGAVEKSYKAYILGIYIRHTYKAYM